jgi:hypothetical protein
MAKKKEITIDEDGGTVTIKMSLSSKDRERFATSLIGDAANAIIEKTGIELDGLLDADTVKGKRGKVTGVWQFKIRQEEVKTNDQEKI